MDLDIGILRDLGKGFYTVVVIRDLKENNLKSAEEVGKGGIEFLELYSYKRYI